MSSVEEHHAYAPGQLAIAVLTASDSRGDREDESGKKIAEMAIEAGHQVVARQIVADEIAAIRSVVEKALEGALMSWCSMAVRALRVVMSAWRRYCRYSIV